MDRGLRSGDASDAPASLEELRALDEKLADFLVERLDRADAATLRAVIRAGVAEAVSLEPLRALIEARWREADAAAATRHDELAGAFSEINRKLSGDQRMIDGQHGALLDQLRAFVASLGASASKFEALATDAPITRDDGPLLEAGGISEYSGARSPIVTAMPPPRADGGEDASATRAAISGRSAGWSYALAGGAFGLAVGVASSLYLTPGDPEPPPPPAVLTSEQQAERGLAWVLRREAAIETIDPALLAQWTRVCDARGGAACRSGLIERMAAAKADVLDPLAVEATRVAIGADLCARTELLFVLDVAVAPVSGGGRGAGDAAEQKPPTQAEIARAEAHRARANQLLCLLTGIGRADVPPA